MVFELWLLLASAALGLVHISATSFSFKAQVGNTYTVGPRDEPIQPLGMAGRMQRAQANFMETFPIFIACTFIVVTTDTAGLLSFWGSAIYVAGRVIYLPLYALGVPWLRTISWNFATFGIAMTGIQSIW